MHILMIQKTKAAGTHQLSNWTGSLVICRGSWPSAWRSPLWWLPRQRLTSTGAKCLKTWRMTWNVTFSSQCHRWPTEEEFKAAKHPHDISHMAPKYWSFNDLDRWALLSQNICLNNQCYMYIIFRTTEIGVAIGAGICLVPYLTYCFLCSSTL